MEKSTVATATVSSRKEKLDLIRLWEFFRGRGRTYRQQETARKTVKADLFLLFILAKILEY